MKNKKNIIKNKFWSRLWQLLKPSHKQIKILFVLVVIVELIELTFYPFILKVILDEVTNINLIELNTIFGLIALMFFVGQFKNILNAFKNRKGLKIIIDLEHYLSIKAQEKLINLSLSYHEKENTGNKITKIEKGIDKIAHLFENLTWSIIPTFTKLFGSLIIFFSFNWQFGLSFISFVPFFIYLTNKMNKKLKPIRKKRFQGYENSSGKMGQVIMNINAVKSFVQEKREISEFKKLRKDIKKLDFQDNYTRINYNFIRNLIIDFGRVAIMTLAIYFIWQGNISVGTMAFVIMISNRAYYSLFGLTRMYDNIKEGEEAVNRFTKLLDQEIDIKNPENGFMPKKINGEIKFKNLSFAYDKKEQKVLKNINLKINAGCVTALVGPSGGGKTTIARMIYRHYDPQKGEILLDDKNLKEYDLYGFRKFITIVPQEVEIFNGTIEYNIAYANPQASFQEIQASARIANAEEFILKQEKKYKTEVGERGIKLSGGQRQRIGIARAILANPRILIFDEATSNLDSYSERLIQDAMEKISKNRTMIIIAHRLSTIKKADKIIVLEDGKIAEQGSHYELAKKKSGLYAKLLKLQKMGEVR